jgi:dipeptidase
MITYTCDGEFHPHLEYSPAADHKPGDSLAIEDWSGTVRGWIKQAPHTYAVIGMMNEHQLAIGETTFDGRLELENKEGLLNYWDLISLALQRAKTAREAITVMTDLMAEYGYGSTGESFSIADTKEAWIMEMIGMGSGRKGAVWVALRIPDGCVAAHANKARIGTFPLNDTENCLYSPNVISLATQKEYFTPGAGKSFSFCDAYCPATSQNKRTCETRVWSIFRRAAPSLNLSADYNRGKDGAKPYPLWIKPDKKLSLADVFALMRDHYEATPYDMTQGVDAGPYGSPLRCRPLTWTESGVHPDSVRDTVAVYCWERSISTQQTGFSFVSQSRSWLPNQVGGVFWYGLDDTYTSCYTPLYCGNTAVPLSFTVGSLQKFSWESAWWVFNFAANFAQVKFSLMAPEIVAVQKEIEGNHLTLQPIIEKAALDLLRVDTAAAVRFLTDYSVMHAEQMVSRWRELCEHLICKFNDGYVKDEKGRPQDAGYPVSWRQEVLRSRAGQLRLGRK